MPQPLSRYFIATTHNTYLEGNQFSSTASAAAISRALLEGFRVVELDCYDGPNGSAPIVTHGNSK